MGRVDHVMFSSPRSIRLALLVWIILMATLFMHFDLVSDTVGAWFIAVVTLGFLDFQLLVGALQNFCSSWKEPRKPHQNRLGK